jgi:hypothetical protein
VRNKINSNDLEEKTMVERASLNDTATQGAFVASNLTPASERQNSDSEVRLNSSIPEMHLLAELYSGNARCTSVSNFPTVVVGQAVFDWQFIY